MTPTRNPVARAACLSRGAWKSGTPGSEGAGTQQCVPATRRFHHRLVRSQGRVGTKGVTFLARWPANKAMQHARDRIRELTERRRLRLSVEWVVEDVNRFLRGWAAYFRYGNSADQFDKISRYARMRMALFVSKRHRRSRKFGWYVVAFASPNQLGLIDLTGTVAAPRPFRAWRVRPNAGGERRR
jgi:hypothetical protein